MVIDAQQAYLESEVLHADPIKLVQMLYRGALQAVGRAKLHLLERDVRSRNRQITKASEILNELALSLDRDRGGEIARNLVELYDYMQRLLQDANFRQIEEPLTELEKLLTTLLEAWDNCEAPAPEPLPSAAVAAGLAEDAGFTYSSRGVAC